MTTTTGQDSQAGTRPVWRGVVEEFRDRLPLPPEAVAVTLLEGGTPLVPAPALSARTRAEVWLKVEGANPTGSFKDRGMTMAMTVAKHAGAEAVLCASTGNTSASAAAYAARAGLTCGVLVPRGRISVGKLAQAVVHGAQLLQVDGSFDDCLVVARKLAEDYPVVLVNSVNPARIEGQKTIAFEIVDALGDAPDLHCLPVGNAGNITAHWQGYRESLEAGESTRLPRMHGVQAAGAAPFVSGAPVADPQTVASAIRIGAPASWDQAIRARDDSGGRIEAVTDDAILDACRWLANHEGVYVEPASAASVAGLLRLADEGRLEPGLRVVCTVTGHGLKDTGWVVDAMPEPIPIAPDPAAAADALGLVAS